MVVTWPKS